MPDRTDLQATAAHLAAFSGNTDLLELLWKYDANFTVVTSSGVSPLHMAAQGNQPKSLDFILSRKEPSAVNEVDKSGATPLIWAAYCGSEVALAYLLAQPEVEINAQNRKGETAMHLCIQTPNGTKPINIIKRLMIKGADQ